MQHGGTLSHLFRTLTRRKHVNISINYQFRHFPWMTFALFGTVWAIHLSIRWFGDADVAREAFGIDFGNAMTYVTHAFIHDGLFHVIGNTLALLAFGAVTEAQVGRRWYGAIVLLGIFAGPAGAFVFYEATGMHLDVRLVGISAATNALFIVTIGILACHWGWGGRLSAATFWSFVALFIIAVLRLSLKELGSISYISAAVCIGLCLCANWCCWRRNEGRPYKLTAMLWVVIPVMAGLLVGRWSYGASGHLAGSVMGAVLALAVLKGESPTASTTWLKGHASCWWSWTCEQVRWANEKVRRTAQTKWFAPSMLGFSLLILAIALRASEFRSTNPLVQFLVGS